ncbi:MAG: hypothetical protein ACK46Q_01950 [Hyphomonas sp.]
MKKTASGMAILGFALAGCATSNPELVRAGLPLGAIEVVNQAEHPITDLRIGICGDTLLGQPDFGYDRLDGQRIAPGKSLKLPASTGCYNISAMTSAGPVFGRTEEFFGIVYVGDEPGSVSRWEIPFT